MNDKEIMRAIELIGFGVIYAPDKGRKKLWDSDVGSKAMDWIYKAFPEKPVLYDVGEKERCPDCYNILDGKVEYCPICGKRLDWEENDEQK